MQLTAKVVWITGASSGIGEALAYHAAARGATVVLSARNTDSLALVQNQCIALGGKAHAIPMDLSNSQSIEGAVAQFEALDLPLHYLINNGGISQRGKVFETAFAVDREIIEVNYFGAVQLTKLLGQYILKHKTHLAYTSSVVGIFGFPLRSSYAASKHALHGFAESLRAEYAPLGVRVTVVCPGRIATQISQRALSADGKPHGKMDEGQAKGMTAETCARLYWKAIFANKKEVLIAREERILVWFRRHMPAIFYFLSSRIKPT